MAHDVTNRGGSGGASPPAFTRTTITSKSPSEAVFIGMTSTLRNGSDIDIDAIDNARKDGMNDEDINKLIYDVRRSKVVNSRPLKETLPPVFPVSSCMDNLTRALKEEQDGIRDVYKRGELVICSQVNGDENISKYHLNTTIDYGDTGMIMAISSQIINKQHYYPFRLMSSELLDLTSNKKASECMDILADGHHFQTSAFHGSGVPHPIVEALQHRLLANSNFYNWNPNPNLGMALLWHPNANIGQPPPFVLRNLQAYRNMYAHISYFPTIDEYIARIGHGTINSRLAYLYQHFHWTLPTYMNYLRRFEGVPCILPGNDLIIPNWGTFPQLFVKQVHRVMGTGGGIYESIRLLSNGNVGARRHVMENYLVSVQNRHQQSEYKLSYLI